MVCRRILPGPPLFPNSSWVKPRAMALGTGLILSSGWTLREPFAGYSGTLDKFALLWLVIDDEAE